MAQQGVQLDTEKFCCPICLDLLKDPATIPCGHSYCMSCINKHWDEEEDKKNIHRCPQCRQNFTPRPVLVKNTMLADLVEELKKTDLQAAPQHQSHAGPGDVACDFCTGWKLKATKSCLQCLASYCEIHLRPHFESLTFQKHKLVEASAKLQKNICSYHDEVMKMFCRTDQQCICYLCSVEQHKGHNTVSAAAQRTKKQRELHVTRQKIQKKIKDREKEVKVLKREVEAINRFALKATMESKTIFTQLVQLIEKRSSDVKQQIRSQQKTEVSKAKELQEKLEQEIAELRRKDAELEQLSGTEDDNHFLNSYASLSKHSDSTGLPRIAVRPLRYFEDAMAAVLEIRDQVNCILSEERTKISQTVTEVSVLPTQAEPKTRDEFLRYSCQITMDPKTMNTQLFLSEGNRRVTYRFVDAVYPKHADRFTDRCQVLSKDGLTGCCYWEVKWNGFVSVAVAYRSISRKGNKSAFGENSKSWALSCNRHSYDFRHKGSSTFLCVPESSTVGVYLDHRAGILSFYSVSETMTLLHRVQTTFTHPLHAGLAVGLGSAELCELQDKR